MSEFDEHHNESELKVLNPLIKCPNCNCVIEIVGNPGEYTTKVTCRACTQDFWIDRSGAVMYQFTEDHWEKHMEQFSLEEFIERNQRTA